MGLVGECVKYNQAGNHILGSKDVSVSSSNRYETALLNKITKSF